MNSNTGESHGSIIGIKPLNSSTTGVSYSRWERLEKSRVRNAAFEFYADANVETTSKFLAEISESRPMYPDVKLAAILKSIPESKISLCFKDSGKFKDCSEHLGNDKVSNFLR